MFIRLLFFVLVAVSHGHGPQHDVEDIMKDLFGARAFDHGKARSALQALESIHACQEVLVARARVSVELGLPEEAARLLAEANRLERERLLAGPNAAPVHSHHREPNGDVDPWVIWMLGLSLAGIAIVTALIVRNVLFVVKEGSDLVGHKQVIDWSKVQRDETRPRRKFAPSVHVE